MGLSHWCRYALASAVIRSTCLKPKNEQKRKHHQAKSCTCRLEHAGCKRDEQMSRFVLVCVCVFAFCVCCLFVVASVSTPKMRYSRVRSLLETENIYG